MVLTPRTVFETMPDELFDMWIKPEIARRGWPFSGNETMVANAARAKYLRNFGPHFWSQVHWCRVSQTLFGITRKALLDKLAAAGYGQTELTELQKLVDAEKSDLFDVLEYISYYIQPISRERRVSQAKPQILDGLGLAQKDFLEFVLFKYIDSGVGELDQGKLPDLMKLKYQTISDATEVLGGVEEIRNLFFNFQKQLYEQRNIAGYE